MNKFTKFVVGVAVAALVLVAGSSKALAYSHTSLLKMGMTNSQVMSLQQALNANGFLVSTTGAGSPGMESMYFGAKTKAAVMAFQSAKGLTPVDGIVGIKTGTALAANTGGSVSYPAGCSSTTGYSTTTGMPCTSTASFPAGCTSTAGYSMTTGMPCNGTSSSNNGGALTGTAGDISVNSYSSGLETQVGEGDSNTKVLGFEVKADSGSDVNLTSVKVTLVNNGSGSKRLNRYAETISIWNENGTKIGSASASDFSESSNVYSRTIPVSVVVRADQKARFFVSVDAASNIDSADYASDNWAASVDNIRFTDATGAILTSSDAAVTRNFNFTSLASANDLELKVNLSSSNMKATTVKVSTTTSTNDVELLKFTLKAQGGKMNLDQLPVTFTTTGATNLSVVTGNVTLKLDGSSFSKSVSSTSTSSTVVFDDLNLDIDADDTITGTVTADINSLGANAATIAQGTTLQAQIGALSSFDVEDENGDPVLSSNSDITGSAVGEIMTFRSTGVNTVMGTPTISYSAAVQGGYDQATYTIPVSVTSFGNTLYLGQTAILASSNTGSSAFAVAFQKSTAPTTDVVSGVTSTITLSSTDAVLEGGTGYRLDDSQTKHFLVTVNLYGGNTAASYRVALKEIATFTNAGLGGSPTESVLLPVEQYQTNYQLITK